MGNMLNVFARIQCARKLMQKNETTVYPETKKKKKKIFSTKAGNASLLSYRAGGSGVKSDFPEQLRK